MKPIISEPKTKADIKKVMIGALVPAALDIGYEVGYEFYGLPDVPTYGKGSGSFRLPNLDDALIDLGVPLVSYLLTGMSDYTVGTLAYGVPMFIFNTWRMTIAEIKAGPGVLATQSYIGY